MDNSSSNVAAFQRALRVIPGGVNSPVRAFRGVGGTPLFVESAAGAYLTDIDGKRYLDYVGSWGPMILGHAHPRVVEAVTAAAMKGTSFGAPTEAETELAELITRLVPSVEMVRLVNSGTEATMSAVRVARGYTKRDMIVKFAGCYHGHGDSFLIAAGSGATTLGIPDSPGVTTGTARDTLLAPFNDLDAVEDLFRRHPDSIAAVIVEPIAGNMGVVVPRTGFLEGLREITLRHGSLLIFDEVMTGFRVARGGAQELLGVKPDLTTFGKVIGGGLPVGAYGGSKEILSMVAPSGPVYQAGTLSGNPLATAAGLATLEAIASIPGFYADLDARAKRLSDGLAGACERHGVPYVVNRMGSMITLFFTLAPAVGNYADAMTSDTTLYGRYFHAMLERGIYLAPSQFEANFVSYAHQNDDIDRTIDCARDVLDEISAYQE